MFIAKGLSVAQSNYNNRDSVISHLNQTLSGSKKSFKKQIFNRYYFYEEWKR